MTHLFFQFVSHAAYMIQAKDLAPACWVQWMDDAEGVLVAHTVCLSYCENSGGFSLHGATS